MHELRISGTGSAGAPTSGFWLRNSQDARLNDVNIVNFAGDYATLFAGRNPFNGEFSTAPELDGPDTINIIASRIGGSAGVMTTEAVRVGSGMGSITLTDVQSVFSKYFFRAELGAYGGRAPSFMSLKGRGGEQNVSGAIRLIDGNHFDMLGIYYGTNETTSDTAQVLAANTFNGPVSIVACYIRSAGGHGVDIRCPTVVISSNKIGRNNLSGTANRYDINVQDAARNIVIAGNNCADPASPSATPATARSINCAPADSIAYQTAAITGNVAPKGLRYRSGAAVAGNATFGIADLVV